METFKALPGPVQIAAVVAVLAVGLMVLGAVVGFIVKALLVVGVLAALGVAGYMGVRALR